MCTGKSKDGYFQYLILYLSEKYGLRWGANQNLQIERIICSKDDLEQALNLRRIDYDQDQADKLLKFSPDPIVEISDGKCFVTVIVDGYGPCLLRRQYQISLDNMKITMTKQELAVNCKVAGSLD